jgi:hypothetical protein
MNLLTLSDGYGDSVAVPAWYPNYWKWPKIIELMTKGVVVNNYSRYGAGNEFIANQLKQNISSADAAIVQWAQPNRLDLVIDYTNTVYWNDIIAKDPVYNNNLVNCGDDKFWISSASTVDAVRKYHQQISCKQHQLRSQIFVEYAKLLINQHQIDYCFMSVVNFKYLDIEAKWICHEPFEGMENFKKKSKYADLDLGITQPLPLVALDFIKQYVIPNFKLPWRSNKEINALENVLYKHYLESIKNRPNDSHTQSHR